MLDVHRLVKDILAKDRIRYSGRRRIGRGSAVVVDIRVDLKLDQGAGMMSTRMESAIGWRQHELVRKGGHWTAVCPHWVNGSVCAVRSKKMYWPLKWAASDQGQMNFPAHCRGCCQLYYQTWLRAPQVTDLAADIRMYKSGMGTLDAVEAALLSGGASAVNARLAMEHEGIAPRMLTREHMRSGR